MQASTLDDICASVGYTATRTLLAWYEGRWLYVPVTATPQRPLARLVGLPALRALVTEFGGERLRIPVESRDRNLRRNREIAEALCRGVSTHDLAQRHDLTLRRVEQIRADLADWGWIEWAAGVGRRGTASSVPRPVLVEHEAIA